MKRLALVALSCLLLGCPSNGPAPKGSENVVIYCAADRELVQDILKDFEKTSGIRVDAKWDTEAAKTTGLAQEILAERARPRCDVFWDNEPLHVIRLADAGVLARLPDALFNHSGNAPRDPEARWIGFAARTRVLIVNTALVSSAVWPTSIRALADPRWKGRAGIANPLFGSTQTHVAALFAKWGEKGGRDFLAALKANDVAVCAGNSDVPKRVASGELALGVTDTDDAYEALSDGKPVAIVFPDQEPGGLGTFFMPNALAIVASAPHPDTAAKLVAYLASQAVEIELAKGAGQHIPLLGATPAARPTWIPKDLAVMNVTLPEIAKANDAARAAVRTVLLGKPADEPDENK
jgi:iron(III) transport system substrate-binding protein